MTEILTESFCERCGSRYTFESAVPKDRMRRVKVFSRGLKTFVLDDKSSFDEALASARSDTDREATSSQLDAFHKTFNFCMQCRQYTCPNCWNEAEGRCLTCAPSSSHEVAAAALTDLQPASSLFGAPAATNGTPAVLGTNGTNGTAAAAAAGAAATNGHTHDDMANGFDAIARLDALSGVTPPVAEAVVAETVVAAPEPVVEAVVAEPEIEAVVADPEPAIAEPLVVAPLAEPIGEAVIAEPLVVAPDPVVAEEPLVDEPLVTAPVEVAEPIGEAVIAESLVALEPAVVVEAVKAEAVVEAVAAEAPEAEVPEATTPDEPNLAEPDLAEPVIEPLHELVYETVPEGIVAPTDDRFEEVLLDLDPPVDLTVAEAQTEVVEVTPEPVAEAVVEPVSELEAVVAEPVVAEAVVAEPTDHRAAAAVAATGALLASMRPGESLDDALDAFERDEPIPDAIVNAPEAEPVAAEIDLTEPAIAAEPEPVVAEPAAVAEVVADPQPEPLPLAADVFAAAVVAAPAPEPEPVVAAPPEPEPVVAAPAPEPAPAVDVVAQPTWTIVAPDPSTPDATPVTPPIVEPAWPTTPEWPVQQTSPGLPFLGRPAVPTGGVDALWAASDRAVTATPGTDRPVAAVQACVSCGLSLSATARFCRRCGTAQH